MNIKYLFIVITLCFVSVFPYINSNKIFATETIFARIETDNVFLYKSPIDDPSYQSFELPKSFFVELLGKANDLSDLFFHARYMDISGYVKKSEVTAIIGTPTSPFLTNINFRVFSPNGLDLKSTPSSATPFNRITNVPYLSTNLVYYGKIIGEQMIPQKSNIWYYCKFIDSSSSYYGYLYSDLCDMLPNIPQNTEHFEIFSGELFPTPTLEETSITTPNLSSGLKTGLVILISLPCFLLIYLLFKPSKIVVDNGQKGKKKIKHLKRRAEYYDFDG